MTEPDAKYAVPLTAGGVLAIEPTDSGFQLELWFREREAIVSIPLTAEEARQFATFLAEVTR